MSDFDLRKCRRDQQQKFQMLRRVGVPFIEFIIGRDASESALKMREAPEQLRRNLPPDK
jgi:hypothetical protein